MRVICAKEPFPRCWKEAYAGCDKALFEKDIKLGKLYLKLLVFKNRKELRAFWDAAEPTKNGGGVGGRYAGGCRRLAMRVPELRQSGR